MNLKTECIEFGKALLETGDLDPIYVMLANSDLTLEQLSEWAMTYFCYYHAGVASVVVEKNLIWDGLVLGLGAYPRGTERRHFRGAKAAEALFFMKDFGTPQDILDYWFQTPDFTDISKRVQEFPQFGPWIAFKVADFGERVLGYEVDFSDCKLGIYKEPYRAAQLIITGNEGSHQDIDDLLRYLTYVFSDFTAPPRHDRPVNVQEVETILCKFKSHLHGHYPIGKDSKEIYHALEGWGTIASKLQGHVPIP